MLLGLAESCIQRQNFRVAQAGTMSRTAFQMVVHIADIPFTGQKYQHVARHGQAIATLITLNFQQDVFHLPGQLLPVCGWPVTHLHRESTPGHFQHRGATEMFGKPLVIDGGRGDDHFQIWPARQQLLEIAKQKIDVQAALVGLINNQGIVLIKKTVLLNFV